MSNAIKNLLFKFLSTKDVFGETKVILIYTYDTNIQNSVNLDGKKFEKIRCLVNYIDVLQTVQNGTVINASSPIINEEEFLKNTKELSEEETANYVGVCHDIILQNLLEINRHAIELSKMISAIKYVGGSLSSLTGSIIVGNNEDSVANIVYNTIEGEIKFDQKDAEKLSKVISDVIFTNAISNIDIYREDGIKKIKDELSYKIIEILPANIKAGDIKINTDFVIRQIEDMQYHNNQFDTREEDDDDDTKEKDDDV